MEHSLDVITTPWSYVGIAALLGLVIAIIALRRKLLARGGAITAAVIAPAYVATGGWWLAILLVSFFASSSLLPGASDDAPARTWRQVLANGGPALLFAALGLFMVQAEMLLASAATLAAAASDTFATELGRRFGGTPVSIITRKPVAPGTSGAISLAGTWGSILGATMIAVFAVALDGTAPERLDLEFAGFFFIALCGLAGSMIDTLLGATLQGRFVCGTCGYRSESPRPHASGHRMTTTKGERWMTNSVVNVIATTSAGGIALGLAHTPIL